MSSQSDAAGRSPGARRRTDPAMEHPTSLDVIGLGTVCWDIVCTVDRYPGLDEKQEISELLQQGGGPTATAIVAVARLGGKAAIWGRVGDDEFGGKCLAEFRAEGVEVRHLEVAPGKTSQFAFCVAEASGLRSIFWKPGNMGVLEPSALDLPALESCRCLLLAHHHAAAAVAAARHVAPLGIPVVLDLERPGPDDDALLAVADYPILPSEYVALRCGLESPLEAGKRLHEELGKPLIVTQGIAGATAFLEGRTRHQPAFTIPQVVDTTGAGDVYHGAFAYGLVLGYGLEENMRFAAAVAALKCRALGGRTGIPSFQEVQRFLG